MDLRRCLFVLLDHCESRTGSGRIKRVHRSRAGNSIAGRLTSDTPTSRVKTPRVHCDPLGEYCRHDLPNPRLTGGFCRLLMQAECYAILSVGVAHLLSLGYVSVATVVADRHLTHSVTSWTAKLCTGSALFSRLMFPTLRLL